MGLVDFSGGLRPEVSNSHGVSALGECRRRKLTRYKWGGVLDNPCNPMLENLSGLCGAIV